jgi:Mrp family chromosome partitioning ATPase
MMAEQNAANEMEQQDKRIRSAMDKIGKKIIIMSGKGGVGKTTVTINLANALVDAGHTVGVLDTDLHGPNVAKMFGCENGVLNASPDGNRFEPVKVREGLYVVSLSFALEQQDAPIIWRGAMKTGVVRQFIGDVDWGTLDYLLIDTPPGTGDEQLTAIQAIPEMTGSIVVTTPQEVAILDSKRSVSFSKKLNVPVIGVIENMSGLICPHCGTEIPVFGTGGGEKMCKMMDVPFLGKIPMEIPLMESEDTGKNYIDGTPESPSSKKMREIALYIDAHTKVSHYDPNDLQGTSHCSPEACAHCTSNCSSRHS